MQICNYDSFVLLMSAAAIANNTTVEPDKIAIYYSDLKEHTADDLTIAFQKCRKELIFFPKIAEIIQRLPNYKKPISHELEIKNKADMAWEEIMSSGFNVYKAPRFNDTMIARIIRMKYGSWETFVTTIPMDKIEWERKSFVEYYNNHYRENETYQKPLLGLNDKKPKIEYKEITPEENYAIAQNAMPNESDAEFRKRCGYLSSEDASRLLKQVDEIVGGLKVK